MSNDPYSSDPFDDDDVPPDSYYNPNTSNYTHRNNERRHTSASTPISTPIRARDRTSATSRTTFTSTPPPYGSSSSYNVSSPFTPLSTTTGETGDKALTTPSPHGWFGGQAQLKKPDRGRPQTHVSEKTGDGGIPYNGILDYKQHHPPAIDYDDLSLDGHRSLSFPTGLPPPNPFYRGRRSTLDGTGSLFEESTDHRHYVEKRDWGQTMSESQGPDSPGEARYGSPMSTSPTLTSSSLFVNPRSPEMNTCSPQFIDPFGTDRRMEGPAANRFIDESNDVASEFDHHGGRSRHRRRTSTAAHINEQQDSAGPFARPAGPPDQGYQGYQSQAIPAQHTSQYSGQPTMEEPAGYATSPPQTFTAHFPSTKTSRHKHRRRASDYPDVMGGPRSANAVLRGHPTSSQSLIGPGEESYAQGEGDGSFIWPQHGEHQDEQRSRRR